MKKDNVIKLCVLPLLVFAMASCFFNDYRGDGKITPRYIKDKASIAQSIMDNLEGQRITQMYRNGDSIPDDKKDMVGFDTDPSCFYLIQTLRYDKKRRKKVPSPKEMQTQMDIIVDTIFYNPDSLLCVGIAKIDKHFDTIPDLKDRSRRNDWWAFIGQRDSINQRFKVYQLIDRYFETFFEFLSRRLVYEYLCEDIAWKVPDVWGTDSIKYGYGINDPHFFTSAPQFKRTSKGDYYFQNFIKDGDTIPYNFYSNSPEYLKKDWKN